MWEYYTEILEGQDMIKLFEVLETHGNENWELAAMTITNGILLLIFKRRKEGEMDA